jgi:hypothetical protein
VGPSIRTIGLSLDTNDGAGVTVMLEINRRSLGACDTIPPPAAAAATATATATAAAAAAASFSFSFSITAVVEILPHLL